ncbi:MAG: DUF2069 domain-containing protein [Vibrio sp.]
MQRTSLLPQTLTSKQLKQVRIAALLSYFALMVWVILWHGLFFPSLQYNPMFIMLVWLLPLLFPLKGLIQAKAYTHLWAGFILMIYFLHSLTLIIADAEKRYFALFEFMLTGLSFLFCLLYAKYEGRRLGLTLPRLSEIETAEKQRYQHRNK